jgi:hypothetical protein
VGWKFFQITCRIISLYEMIDAIALKQLAPEASNAMTQVATCTFKILTLLM